MADQSSHLCNQVPEVKGDLTDEQDAYVTCTNWWWAAMADMTKGMYNTFAETGVFVSVCWHGTIWTILDMMKSGELVRATLQ